MSSEGVIETVLYSDIYADKEWISADWQLAIARRTRYRICTLTPDHQHLQHSHPLKRFISRVRQRLEGVFHEIHAHWP
ncbi:hypothetical protein [Fischerella sp. JS2]|uniref:hypothetical protein n=1 Tax=Fischerella sp. JS2 TaxID=2597771 RepID=UPI0028E5FAFB|nr:hypothetical protein [Fischerella sp. JS2]